VITEHPSGGTREREAFKGVNASPSAVREAVEKKIASPGLYRDFRTCTRVGEKN
jgi:hypothetical protein